MSLYDRNNEVSSNFEQEISSEISSQKGKLIKDTYALLTASMIAAVAGSYVGMLLNIRVNFVVFLIVTFGIMFGLNSAVKNRQNALALILLFVFTTFTGFTLGYIFNVYIGAGLGKAITQAFVTTAVGFAALTYYAMNTKRDFSKFWKPMTYAFWGVFAMAILNYFVFHSGILGLGISVIIGLLSAVFIVMNTKAVINGEYSSPILAAASMYVDIYNLFTSLLHIFGFANSNE